MTKVVYIAGQITGDPMYKQKFLEAERALKALEYIVLNPAKNPDGLTNQEYMRLDLSMIDVSDAVYFLSDWVCSEGAKLEMAYARYMKKEIMGAGWLIE